MIVRKPSITALKKEVSPEQREELLRTLKTRFEKNMKRHKGVEWAKLQVRLEANSEKLWSLNEMERTGGEPDVVGFDEKTGEYVFVIVRRRVLRVAEMLFTMVKGRRRGKSRGYIRKVTLLIWRLVWPLSF